MQPIVLISEVSDFVIMSRLKMAAQKAGFEPMVCPSNGEIVLKTIFDCKPEAVLISSCMSKFGAAEVKSSYDAFYSNAIAASKPNIKFFAMGSFSGIELEKELNSLGFLFYFIHPVDEDFAFKKIAKYVMQKSKIIDKSDEIFSVFCNLGMPTSICGFNYAKTAILLILQDYQYANMATKCLYPEVAKIYGTTAYSVERNIRTAVESVFRNANPALLKKVFPCYQNNACKRATNLQFLTTVAGIVASRHKKSIG